MTTETSPKSISLTPVLMTTGLVLLTACILLPGVEYRPRYNLVALPTALFILLLSTVRGGKYLREQPGSFALVFAVMLSYGLSAAAKIDFAGRIGDRYPWLLPWSSVLLLLLTVPLVMAVRVNREEMKSFADLWRPMIWTLAILLACGLAMEIAIAHMAGGNSDYRTPDWLEPQFTYFHTFYRCIEYALLFFITSYVTSAKIARCLGWSVAALLVVKAVLSLAP